MLLEDEKQTEDLSLNKLLGFKLDISALDLSIHFKDQSKLEEILADAVERRELEYNSNDGTYFISPDKVLK